MRRLTIILIFFVGLSANANDISKINELKKNAKIAYKAGQYEVAASNYSYLIDSLYIEDEQAIVNLGHTYYQLGKQDLAQAQYQKLVLSENEALKSVAYQQLGALSKDPKTLEKSLSYFKESIKSDPSNEDARYNYELVKKKLKEQKQNQDQNQDQDQDQENQENKDEEKKDQDNKEDQDQQQDQNKDQEQKDSEKEEQQQKDQEQQDQEGEKDKEEQEQQGQEDDKKEGEENEQEQPKPEEGKEGEEEKKEQPQTPSPGDKMQEMNISEEKAKMILEALKNSEVQYIQQNRRKPTKRKDSDKPDW